MLLAVARPPSAQGVPCSTIETSTRHPASVHSNSESAGTGGLPFWHLKCGEGRAARMQMQMDSM